MARTAPAHVRVETDPPYPVHVGEGILERVGEAVAELGAPPVALICDADVADLHLPALRAALAGAERIEIYPVPPGEASKTVATFGELCRRLATDGFDRSCVVVALGGGVTGDLAGFVAASYLRGVPFVNVPSSHLAMVDASVGGKTGVNLPEGKNLVGAFWQPRAVVADVALLATLPPRVYRQGAVETFKHGLLADASLLEVARRPELGPAGDPAAIADLVARSVAVKARVVAADTTERGVRAHLNLGHTLGHALEKASGHALAHGDAVAYGLLFAALLSEGRGWNGAAAEVLELLRWLEPDPLPPLELGDLLPYVARDKKRTRGTQRWVLLAAPQQPRIVAGLEPDELENAWWRFLERLAAETDTGADAETGAGASSS